MNCKELSFLISVERERGLSLGERARMRLHLGVCAGCRRFRRQMRLLQEALARSEGALAQHDLVRLSPGARQRIQAAFARVN